MNDDFGDLEERVATALQAVAGTVPDEPPHSFLDEEIRRQSVEFHRSMTGRRPRSVRRAAIVGVSAVVVCGAILGGLVVTNSSNRHSAVTVGRAHSPTSTMPLTGYRVVGYTSTQATAVAAECLSAANARGVKDAYLRATFSDSSGSTLVVTTPSGWYTCNESADGTVLVAGIFESYATAQGWGLSLPPGNPTPSGPKADESAHWLTSLVELDSESGGYYSKSTISEGWLDTAVGRVAPNIAKVTIQMPGGSTITSSVENGFFVARQLLPSVPSFNQGVIPITGYDRSGKLVYPSQTSPFAPCFVTPSGQPVTPSGTSGQKCLTATAW